MKIRIAIATAVAVACVMLGTNAVQAQGNLFSQYYTQGAANQTTAGMYPAPHWVPREMGHTYYTYQPLMPHEMMYQHSRNYYNYYGTPRDFYTGGCQGANCGYQGGSRAVTVTKVRWQAGSNHMFHLPGGHNRPSLGGLFKGHHSKCAGGKCGTGHHGLGHLGGNGCDSCGGASYGSAAYGGESYEGSCDSGNCSAQLPELTIER